MGLQVSVIIQSASGIKGPAQNGAVTVDAMLSSTRPIRSELFQLRTIAKFQFSGSRSSELDYKEMASTYLLDPAALRHEWREGFKTFYTEVERRKQLDMEKAAVVAKKASGGDEPGETIETSEAKHNEYVSSLNDPLLLQTKSGKFLICDLPTAYFTLEKQRQRQYDSFLHAVRERDAVPAELIMLEEICTANQPNTLLDRTTRRSLGTVGFKKLWPLYLQDPKKFREKYKRGFGLFYGVPADML